MRSFIMAISIMMLSACGSSIGEVYQPQPKSKPTQVQKLETVQTEDHCAALNYYEALLLMNEEQIKQEELMLREDLRNVETGCVQLQLAMLLSMPAAGFKNEHESEQVLKLVLNKNYQLANQDIQIARLLLEQLQQRFKLRGERQSLKKQLQKERAASLKLLEKLSDTESKLKQLKNIEKDINKQEQEISTPSTDKIPHDKK